MDSDSQHSDTVINGQSAFYPESLFSLREDTSETLNFMEAHPELAAKMKQRLAELVNPPRCPGKRAMSMDSAALLVQNFVPTRCMDRYSPAVIPRILRKARQKLSMLWNPVV
jgi:hypothetical protein